VSLFASPLKGTERACELKLLERLSKAQEVEVEPLTANSAQDLD
jgi:hypothetical protein